MELIQRLQCPCPQCAADSSRRIPPSPRLIHAVEYIESLGGLQVITSGVRCIDHNHDVGGTLDSKHLSGEAADLLTPDSQDVYKTVKAAMGVDCVSMIEVCPHHVHIDVRGGPKKMITGNG